jgi:hypothetical protein
MAFVLALAYLLSAGIHSTCARASQRPRRASERPRDACSSRPWRSRCAQISPMTLVVGIRAGNGQGDAWADRRWSLVPASWGSGDLLVGTGALESDAWTPPGVAFTGREDEEVDRWRRTKRRAGNDCDGRDETLVVSLSDVLSCVPVAYRSWAIDATSGHLAAAQLWLRLAECDAYDGADEGEAVASLRRAVTALQGELDKPASERFDQAVSAPLGQGAVADDALATFSDADLKPLVGTLLRAEFSLSEDDNFAWLDWPEVIRPATGRVTVRIMMTRNYDPRVVIRGVTDEAQQLAARGGAKRGELYCFVSASRLEASLWRTLRRSLEQLLPDASHVLDARGLRALADKHVDASRSHIKYWMAHDADHALKTWGDQPLLEGGDLALPRLVETKAYHCAREMLHKKRSIVIYGQTGTGKSTLARMLLADAALVGYERVEIEDGTDVAAALESVARPAVFVDDVTHPIAARDIAKRTADRDGLTIVAIRGGLAVVDCCDSIGLTHYDRSDRARMLYNKLWHDRGLSPGVRNAFLDPDLFRAVIDAPQFTPVWCASSSKLSKIVSMFDGASPSRAYSDEIDGMVERLRYRLGDLASGYSEGP